MSAIKEFNSLGGKTVTRKELNDLVNKAHDEKSWEVHKRVLAILDKHKEANEFEFAKNAISPIKETSKLGIPVKLKVYSKEIDGNLVFFYGEKMLATIRPNGLIQYETSRLPRGARNTIRKASNEFALNSPIDENMLFGIDYQNETELDALGKPVSQNEIYSYVTDLIINTIKEVGHLPWQKEWVGSGSDGEAKNYVTKKPYQGINFILLNFDIKMGKDGKLYLVPIQFEQPYYLTFNQIEEAKATLKKGSKARRVIYYTMVFTYDDGDLQFSTSDKLKFTAFIKENGLTAEKLDRYSYKVPVVKYYNVYRADDCIGLKFPEQKAKPQATPIEQAQAIIDGFPNPPKYTFIGSIAAYYPLEDKINMPKIQAFKAESSYYCTFFHEMIHSTGHEKRLNRFAQNQKKQKDRKKEYAFEELIAELGAVYLCSQAGILFTTIENSAKYLNGWNSRLVSELENDNRFFFKASAQAQKAANHILNISEETEEVETKKPKSVTKKAENVTKKPKTVTKNAQTPKKPTNKVAKDTSKVQESNKRVSGKNVDNGQKLKIPLVMFHASVKSPLENIPDGAIINELGIHLGTKKTAQIIQKKHKNYIIRDFKVNLKNPIQINDFARWEAFVVSRKLLEMKIISKVDFNKISKKKGNEKDRFLVELLKTKNYDGFIYENYYEGGGISCVVFDKKQISEAGKKAGEKKNIVKVTNPRTKKTAVIDKEKGKILRYENPKTFDKKPKSVSVATAIKDVLTLPKYKGNKLLVATILYNKFKDFKNDDFFEIELNSEYEKGVLKNDSELHSYFYYTEELSLTEKGHEFVKAVNARLESLRNQKHNYAMFDNLANPENIEVIEPNPVIPFVAQIPEEKEEVLDQVNIPKTSLPTQKKSRLMSMTFETLPMKGKFANLMQHPAKNLKIGIFGKPKNGKTGGSLQLAEYLTQFGNVLYNFADQGFNLSTQKLWKESGLANYPEDVAYPSDVTTLDELEREIATGNYQFVFIDLINDYIDREKVTPQEFKDRFIRKYDNVGFILVFESTKSGDFKGDQKWMHVVDAIANVEDFVMTMRGRYGNGEFLIWEQGLKDVNPAKYQEWLEKYSETIEPENLEFSDEIETI